MASKEMPVTSTPEVLAPKFGLNEQFSSIMPLLQRASEAFAPPNFDVEEDNLEYIAEDVRVLVVGAGGLGCELLKNLALSGFRDIEVIDLDTIELSNLNRQFLFRKPDIGKSKSHCAAKFVMQRVPGCKITAHHKPIQQFGSEFYQKFNVVIAGLDNVKARRWLNAKLFSLVKYDKEGNIDPESIIPLIDGGTEGFKGHVRLFLPGLSSCFECSLDALPPQTGFQLCTLQGKPRKPEHCVAYAKQLLWPKLKFLKGLKEGEWELARTKDEAVPGVTWDSDDAIHMTWMYHRALERAEEFGIEGVTYNMTMQVTKNIIPAIASTNALVSAACVAEAFKVTTYSSYSLNNWFMYMGQNGCYTNTYEFDKKPFCTVCGEPKPIQIDRTSKLSALLGLVKEDGELANPSISGAGKTLYNSSKFLKAQTAPNLEKTLDELFEGKDQVSVVVTDANLAAATGKYIVNFTEGVFWQPAEDMED